VPAQFVCLVSNPPQNLHLSPDEHKHGLGFLTKTQCCSAFLVACPALFADPSRNSPIRSLFSSEFTTQTTSRFSNSRLHLPDIRISLNLWFGGFSIRERAQATYIPWSLSNQVLANRLGFVPNTYSWVQTPRGWTAHTIFPST
jgi:hypothetical protein